MIKLTDTNGHAHYVSPAAIARITEASVSGKWHGIMAYVKLFDGKTIEARESAVEIGIAVDQAMQQGGSE